MAPVKLTDKDVDALIRVVATESDPNLAWSHPDAYVAQVRGITDTVLNRVASGRWGDSVADVANAKNQFSAINGPKNGKYKVWGSVDRVPASLIPAQLPNVVKSWLTQRGSGTPSSVGGGLNYANPYFSDASNLTWINKLDGPKLGYGKSIHYHGTTAGFTPVEAQVIYGGGFNRLQDIHDRQAAAQGFGEIAPVPLSRPNYFNETGVPPIPAIMSASLRAPSSLVSDAAPLAPLPKPAPLSFNIPQVAAPIPATMSPALAASRQSAPAVKVASIPQTATLPTGKTVEVGRLYSIGGNTYRGAVGADGIGALEKLNSGILGEAGKPTIAGHLVDNAIGNVVRTEAPKIASAAGNAVGGLASSAGNTIGGFFDGLFGSKPAAPAVKAPAPVRVPTGPTMNGIGAGASFADLQRFNPPASLASDAPPIPATMSPQLAAVRKSVPALPPIPMPHAQGMLARANAMKAPPTLPQALGTWFSGTPLGQGVDLLSGKLPQPSGGGLLGAILGTRDTRSIMQRVAQQALNDPLGFKIGEANRRSPNPSYDITGADNAFNPISVQNSSRWQTGY